LFTDIAASTEVAVELGDRRWRALQARHHSEVRKQLKRHGGREIDTAGDGFFATFSSPQAGVRCAFAIVLGVRELGLDVRAGLHFGEVESSGEKVGGIAVTTAQRVESAADGGQVLVTDTIAHLVAGSGLEFTDVGSRELKGVPGVWNLFSLDAVDGRPIGLPLDPSDAAETRKRLSPEPAARRNTRLLVPGVIAGILVIAVVGALAIPRPSHSTTSSPSVSALSGAVAAKIDTTDGSVMPVDVPNIPMDAPVGPVVLTQPMGLSGQSFAWFLSFSPASTAGRSQLSQIDRANGTLIGGRRVSTCLSPGPCMTVVGSTLWLAVVRNRSSGSGISVMRIDPTGEQRSVTMPVTSQGEVAGSVRGMTFGDGALWIGDTVLGTVFGVDITTGQPRRPIRLPGGVDGLAYGDGSLWVVDRFEGLLERINPDTGRVVDHTALSGDPTGLVVGGGYVWVTDGTGDGLEKIPTTLTGSNQIHVGAQPVAVAYAEDAVWVANHDDATVSKIDPSSNEVVRTYSVGLHPSAIAVGEGQLWVAGNPSGIDRS
jgi:YVTN family beta-propeller protein